MGAGIWTRKPGELFEGQLYLLPFVFLLWVTIGMDIREQQLAG